MRQKRTCSAGSNKEERDMGKKEKILNRKSEAVVRPRNIVEWKK